MSGVGDGYTLITNSLEGLRREVEAEGEVGSLLLLDHWLALVPFVTPGSRLCSDLTLRFEMRGQAPSLSDATHALVSITLARTLSLMMTTRSLADYRFPGPPVAGERRERGVYSCIDLLPTWDMERGSGKLPARRHALIMAPLCSYRRDAGDAPKQRLLQSCGGKKR